MANSEKFKQFKIVEKDVVDELIFRADKQRNRLMLELMVCSCMRVGEVLRRTPKDIEDRKAPLREAKSAKEADVVFLSQKVTDRLQEYIPDNEIKQDNRIFQSRTPVAGS